MAAMEGSGVCCGPPIGVLLILIGVVYRWIAKDYQRSAIDTRALPVTAIAAVKPGVKVAVEGVVESEQREASPVTGAEGVMLYWEVVGSSTHRDRAGVETHRRTVLTSQLLCRPFWVRDDSGRARVEPWDAQISVAAEETDMPVPFRSDPNGELATKVRALVDDASKLDGWHAVAYHERVVLPDHPVFVEGVAAPESTAGGAGYRDARGLVFRHDEAQPLRIHTSTRDQVVRRKQQLSREVWRVAVGFWVAGVLFIAVPLLWTWLQRM